MPNASSEFYMNKLGQTQDKEDQQTYKLLAARVLISENKVPQAEELLTELVDLNEAQPIRPYFSRSTYRCGERR